MRCPRLLLASVVGSILGGAVFVSAELVQIQAESTSKNNAADSVYVRDSGVASEKLALAERMERLKEWDKSANVYQEIIDKYPDRVVPTRNSDKGDPIQYASVALVVQEKLAKWPEEGLKVYRARYEDAAKDLLAKAGDDRDAMNRVFWQYFHTDTGKSVGLKLLAAELESGDFASAAWTGQRLLSFHPSLVVERPAVLFQTAIAEQLSGNIVEAKTRVDELKQRFPAATGTVRGKDVVLADALTSVLAEPPALAKRYPADSWTMQFGTPDASAVPDQVSTGGARVFTIDVAPPPKLKLQQFNLRSNYEKQLANSRKLGNLTGIMPAIDHGELFFQDNARVYAINLNSGLPLAGWLQTYPGDKRGMFAINDIVPTPQGKQLGITVTPQRVLALLGQNDFNAASMMGVAMQGGPQVVCLDRSSGKRLWSTTPGKLQTPQEQANIKEGTFCGSPLVVDGSVYILLRATRGGQFDECHAVSLKLSDGSFQWSSYIASVANAATIDFDGMPVSDYSPPGLSYSDGRLYVQSNLGAMACLNAADGSPLWLNLYPRRGEGMLLNGRRNMGQIVQQLPTRGKPYAQNPPIVSDGRLFILTPDGPNILVYDAASGEEIRRIPRMLEGRSAADAVDMLIGVVNDQLILANRSTVYVVPWKTYDPKKNLIDNNCRYRRLSAFGPSEQEDNDAIRGRPLVTSKHIIVPTGANLYQIRLDDSFQIDNIYPVKGVWDETEESPGNVIATQDHLVVAGPEHVTVYADLSVATAKLDAVIAKNPEDVESYLRYAELLIVGGKQTEAIDWLDKAMTHMGGRQSLARGPTRDHLFEITSTFAVKLQRNDAGSSELIRQLFERARDAADSPQQHVRYSIAHAQFLARNEDLANATTLYQDILSHPTWRPVPVTGASGASTAAAEAEAAIIELLKRNTTIYTAYESKAAAKLAAVMAGGKPSADDLLAIADEYPIDKSGFEALRQASINYEDQSRPHDAVRALRRLLQHAHTADDRAPALESLARIYAGLPGQLDLAIVRMRQAAEINPGRKLSKPISSGPDQTISNDTYQNAVALLRTHRNALTGKALPSFKLPSSLKNADKPPLLPAESLAGVTGIIPQDTPGNRTDRVVVLQGDKGVTQIPAGTLTPMHKPVKVDGTPFGCAYSDELLIVVGTEGIVAIDARTDRGEVWRAKLNALPAVELSIDAATSVAGPINNEDGDVVIDGPMVQRQMIIRNGQRIVVQGGGIVRINGRIMLGQAPDQEVRDENGPERIMYFQVLSDRVVIATSQGRVASFDLGNGNLAWQSRPMDQVPTRFLAIDDFVVASSSDGMSSDVFVLDGISGKTFRHINYDMRANSNQELKNLALSPDGVLVSMLREHLEAVDLFDANPTTVHSPASTNGEPAFSLSNFPDQLVVADERVLALFTSASGTQSVKAYDLRTMKPMKMRDSKGNNTIDASYPSGAQANPDRVQGSISIHAVGPAFYIFGPRSLMAYHLDNEEVHWNAPPMSDVGVGRDFVITQEYAVLLNGPRGNEATNKLTALQISAYSRAVVAGGGESGVLDQRTMIRDNARVINGQWQIANDALYYVSGDDKLKMLKANQ